jgi:hypothetical protein
MLKLSFATGNRLHGRLAVTLLDRFGHGLAVELAGQHVVGKHALQRLLALRLQ